MTFLIPSALSSKSVSNKVLPTILNVSLVISLDDIERDPIAPTLGCSCPIFAHDLAVGGNPFVMKRWLDESAPGVMHLALARQQSRPQEALRLGEGSSFEKIVALGYQHFSDELRMIEQIHALATTPEVADVTVFTPQIGQEPDGIMAHREQVESRKSPFGTRRISSGVHVFIKPRAAVSPHSNSSAKPFAMGRASSNYKSPTFFAPSRRRRDKDASFSTATTATFREYPSSLVRRKIYTTFAMKRP